MTQAALCASHSQGWPGLDQFSLSSQTFSLPTYQQPERQCLTLGQFKKHMEPRLCSGRWARMHSMSSILPCETLTQSLQGGGSDSGCPRHEAGVTQSPTLSRAKGAHSGDTGAASACISSSAAGQMPHGNRGARAEGGRGAHGPGEPSAIQMHCEAIDVVAGGLTTSCSVHAPCSTDTSICGRSL